MKLSSLLSGIELLGDPPPVDLEISEVSDDSRRVGPGHLFIALSGLTVDGHRYLSDAAAKGAVAALLEREVPPEVFSGPRIRVASTARALGQVAANRHGRPGDALALVGITGTNGKTTTSFLAEALCRAGGGEPGLIGTVATRHHGRAYPSAYTTPTPLQLHATLAEMRAAGCTHAVMECSSHALAQHRLEGVRFDVAAFTNLTQDHLDLHGTMEAYGAAKARLFSEHLRPGGKAVILVDREGADLMARAAGGALLPVSARPAPAAGPTPAVHLLEARHDVAGIAARFATPVGEVALRSPLIGGFNLENLAVAVGIGVALGLPPEAIGRALCEGEGARGAPGRLERVPAAEAHGFSVFVDYAHTPDALARALAALRPLTRGRLVVVFGCGGDRDRGKRPLMGAAAARAADLTVVTSDNPRSEAPQAIIDEILAGVPAATPPPVVIVDRREAISTAVREAQPGDVILIAGKGHEDYQLVGGSRLHFDDREEAGKAVQEIGTRSSERSK